MKKKKIRKIVSCLLSMVLMFITLISPAVYATEENMLTSSSDGWFATKDELLNYNTNDIDGNKLAKKVYFGNNNQEWWIVGQDPSGEGLVLFAASPLDTGKDFESDHSIKTYNSDWGTYENDPPTVKANHYGASDLRTILRNMEKESSRFSVAEQAMMQSTKISTYDTLNNRTYTTEDKLYALYGDYDNDIVTAGTNSVASLNGGLRIDSNYWGSNKFWLRSAMIGDEALALVANTVGGFVVYAYTNRSGGYAVVPAFQLNLSSALFASSAKAATTNGSLSTSADTFTLRYKADNSNPIGSVSVDALENTIDVKDSKNGAYLVVQNSSGAWAKSVKGSGNFNATDVNASLTSLVGCKVWLEFTENRITTAAEPITIEKAPTPKIVTKQTANSITIEPIYDGLPNPYYGLAEYKLETAEGSTIEGWQASNVFKDLKADTTYTVYARYGGDGSYLASEGSETVKTSAASYTITIPKNVTAGDNSSGRQIAVNKNEKFELGHKGQVYVRVSNQGALSNDGTLTMTRQKDTSTKITSSMYVNGSPFTNITKDVAVFESNNDSPVTVAFKELSIAQGIVIPAGDYSATVTYEINYRENP